MWTICPLTAVDLLLPLSPPFSLFKGFGRRASYLVKTTQKLCLGAIAGRTENRSYAFIFVSFGLEVLSTFFKTLTTSDNLLCERSLTLSGHDRGRCSKWNELNHYSTSEQGIQSNSSGGGDLCLGCGSLHYLLLAFLAFKPRVCSLYMYLVHQFSLVQKYKSFKHMVNVMGRILT